MKKLPIIAMVLVLGLGSRFARGQEDSLAVLVEVIKNTSDPAAQNDMLRGMAAALEGRRLVKMPAGWQELYEKLAKSDNEEVRRQSQKLAAIFGDAAALDKYRATALDPRQPPEARRRAMESLAGKADASMVPLLQGLLKDPVLREQAVKGLAGFDDPRTPAIIIENYSAFDVSTRLAALNTLSFRKTFAAELMKAVKALKIPKGDLTAYTIRQLGTFGNKEIDAWIKETWGVVRTTPDQKIKEIEKFKTILSAAALQKGDASQGRAVFAKTCQQCHTLYNEGGKVGPDITGSNRADLDYLLTNVIDPSAVIAKDYQVTNLWTKDDQILSGIITKEDERSITLVTETSTSVLQRSEIETMKKSELSMMPEGILLPLSQQEIINMVAYLRGASQVALPPDFKLPEKKDPAQKDPEKKPGQ